MANEAEVFGLPQVLIDLNQGNYGYQAQRSRHCGDDPQK